MDTSSEHNQIHDVLRIPVVPADPAKDSLGMTLDRLLEPIFRLMANQHVGTPFVPESGLIGHMASLTQSEIEVVARQNMTKLIHDLRAYFYTPDPDRPETNSGQIRLHLSWDGLLALLTLTPPRGEGTIPTLNTVKEVLNRSGITYHIDTETIEKSLRTIRQTRDIVWRAIVARGEPSIPQRFHKPKYRVSIIDKSQFRLDLQRMQPCFAQLAGPVPEGEIIGTLDIETGQPGRDIFGNRIPPPKEKLSLDLGDIALLEDNSLTSQAPGYVVADNSRLDMVPFYIMDHPTSHSIADFSFPGAVLVLGNLRGPGSIECEDLFVIGNCEQIKVVSHNDVFVSGGIVGHSLTSIDADGSIYSSFVSEAKLTAVSEIVVSNAILNSHITTNDIVKVTSNKGMIAGGATYSLRGIIAATLGAEFGMRTETFIGKDFLTPARLKTIIEKIELHEENLRRINELKAQMARSRMSIERMPPDKQEIYIGVLRKEQHSQSQLRSLLRQKKTLSQGLNEFLSATVQVLDTLYPPVRVRIADSIRDITEKLNRVTLSYNKDHGIIKSLIEEN